MSIVQLFNGANLFVLPFWALAILLPNWRITRQVMESFLPFVVLVGMYLYLIAGIITPSSVQALSNSQLAALTDFFRESQAVAVAWVHFLVMDLFVGRWIYWDGQQTGIWTAHSLVLCLFVGPLGLLSHILTKWVSGKFLWPLASDLPESVPPSTKAI